MDKIKEAALVGVSWGVGIAVSIGVFAIILEMMTILGMASWDKQGELDCYKKLDKQQCEILFTK